MLYKFKKSFKYGNETVESVELKEEFNVGDMVRVMNSKGTGDQVATILACATGWPLPKVAMISIEDGMALNEAIAPFFGLSETDGPET